jgi:beta-lactamase regulating signal transducer with metallopeptidase domain
MRIIEYIPEPFVNALAWSILHSIWQIAVIALLWRVSVYFTRNSPALVSQNLSIFALLTIPVVFIITFLKQYSIYSEVQRIAFVEFEGVGMKSLEGLSSLYVIQKENTSLTNLLEGYSSFIFWIYLAGIALMSVYFVLSYSKLFRAKTRNLKQMPDKWLPTVSSARARSGISKKISVYLSPNVTVPLVAGFFKPVVLLPLAISASLSIQEVENILLHEFYHIRCKDHYVNAMQYVLEILFFYHPFTWWISQTLRSQRESKVDEWVVEQTNNPLKYAQTLLYLEEKRQSTLQPALAASSSKNTLLSRIKNIMHMKTRNFNPGQKIAAIIVIAAATISLAWMNPPSFLAFTDVTKENGTFFQVDESTPEITVSPSYTSDSIPAEPGRIVLEDGKSIQWAELSEEEKEEVRKALQEARLAIREAMEEVRAELNSEEMKEEMRQAREEIRMALAEVKAEMNNEEFRAEMQKAREEIRKAIQEMNQTMGDEQFKAEMDEVSKELQKVFEELNNFDWAELGNNLGIIMEEAGKSLEIIGPTLNEVFENLNLEELLKEIEYELEEKEQ